MDYSHYQTLTVTRRGPDGAVLDIQMRSTAAFDTSLALEFMGFAGPDVKEGLASLRQRRPPRFQCR